MTVREVIEALSAYAPDQLVYIPTVTGECQTVAEVGPLQHVGLPDGIAIPDDVVLLPGGHDEMVAGLQQRGCGS